jgi:hypothetical protein
VQGYTPWNSNCLVQTIAAKLILQRRGVSSTLYLGVAPDTHEALQAHAWLRSGSIILTGAPGHRRYTVIATFT